MAPSGGNAGGSMGPRGAPNASHDASGKQQHAAGKPPNSTENADAHWRKIIDCLNEVGDDLKKDSNKSPLYDKVQEATRLLRDVWTQASRNENPMEDRLARIEDMMKAVLLVPNSPNRSPTASQKILTWADVASRSSRTGSAPSPPPTDRPTVRIRIPDAAGKTPKELLDIVKPTISGAYAARSLRSGDIEIMVPDQRTKDRILNQAETEGIKILRQDYPIEIWGVPLSLQVHHGKSADNTELIKAICTASKRMLPDLAINRIGWLHNPKQHKKRLETGKQRGTLIISCPTQEIQHHAIRSGIVIDSQFYEAMVHDRGVKVQLCYNCNHWGHTQAACGKPTQCGRCAGGHQTTACSSEKISCASCGQRHRAWQRAACPTFLTYLQSTQDRRAAALAQTDEIRRRPASVPPPPSNGFTIVPASRKRDRSPQSTSQPLRPGPGRPSHIAVAARNPRQGRIALRSGSQAESTYSVPSSQNPPTEDLIQGESEPEL
jgi:hypothetical protein